MCWNTDFYSRLIMYHNTHLLPLWHLLSMVTLIQHTFNVDTYIITPSIHFILQHYVILSLLTLIFSRVLCSCHYLYLFMIFMCIRHGTHHIYFVLLPFISLIYRRFTYLTSLCFNLISFYIVNTTGLTFASSYLSRS